MNTLNTLQKLKALALFALSFGMFEAIAQQLPGIVTCKIPNPLSEKAIPAGQNTQPPAPFKVLASDCSPAKQAAACARSSYTLPWGYSYLQNVKPIPDSCQIPANKEDMIADLTKSNYYGAPAYGVSCHVKDSLGYVWYNAQSKGSSPAQQRAACESENGFTEPIPGSLKTFKSSLALPPFLAAAPKRFGIECKVSASGSAYRVIAPGITDAIKNYYCKPGEATVTEVKMFEDPNAAVAWSKQYANNAILMCKLNETGVPIPFLVADCNADTQRSACFEGVSEPISCEIRDIAALAKYGVDAKAIKSAREERSLAKSPFRF